MRKILILIICYSSLSAGIPMTREFLSPTSQLLKRESRTQIEVNLKAMHLPLQLMPFFEATALKEAWGHLGYHGSNQNYRIYQDIIRMVIEEIVGLPVRENFQFLRVPGDPDLNLNTLEEFEALWGKLDNRNPLRAKQLLSLNFSIYSNSDEKASCSLNLFVKDSSRTDVDYVKQLTPFFQKLGLSRKAPAKLFAIGRKWLDDEGGILLQISERTDDLEAYNFVDSQGYPAKHGGYRYGNYPLSNHYELIMTNLYLEKKLDIAPQLRLLINNRYTLNPHSYLDIKRYDLYDAETIASYEEELRAYVRTLSSDAQQVDKYKTELLQLWE